MAVNFLIGLSIFVADFIAKYLTNEYLPLMDFSSPLYPYGGIPIFDDFMGIEFSLSHATNRGAAWGAFADYQALLLAARVTLSMLLLGYLLFYNKQRRYEIPLVMIIAGAMGNIVDYFLYGHVIDMLHFVLWGYDFPVFNLADTSIFLGVSALLVLSWIEKKTVLAP